MVSFSSVAKRYPGGQQALKDVSFVIGEGELAFITGRSGAGKSTLLKLIPAIERPTSGSVIVKGQNISALKHAAKAANTKINGYALSHPEYRGMGTTATIAGLLGDTIYVAQIGDSRGYLIRDSVGRNQSRRHCSLASRSGAGYSDTRSATFCSIDVTDISRLKN